MEPETTWIVTATWECHTSVYNCLDQDEAMDAASLAFECGAYKVEIYRHDNWGE